MFGQGMTELLKLGDETRAFASGGNRLCFIDPRDNNRCIKVLRADRSPEIKRGQASFFGRLRPLRHFDENLQEQSVYYAILKRIGEQAYQLIPEYYGVVKTDYGLGFCSELIKDDDGRISISLKQYVWQQGFNTELKKALENFKRQWCALGMPSRNLLLHNIVVQQNTQGIVRLVVIDGLGWPLLASLFDWFPGLPQRKAQRKAARLDSAIEKLLEKKQRGGDWGYHGWLNEDKR